MSTGDCNKPVSAGALQRTCPRCGGGKRRQDAYCETCTGLIKRVAYNNINLEADDVEAFEMGAGEGLKA